MMDKFGYIGRKMRLPSLEERPAIVIAAFGTSTRAGAGIEKFNQRLQERFSEYELFQAYTSDIIRKKMNLPGLRETLSSLESRGYRKAVVQPLHIFPGTEYTQLVETCASFPGLRIIVGETLMHRWQFVKQVLAIIESEFLPDKQGINILALHGSPLAAEPVNTLYLGLEQMVRGLYPNVFAASVEGVPDVDALLARLSRMRQGVSNARVRIIPVMFAAGMHVMDDLMGEDESWRTRLETMGFSQVDMPAVEHQGQEYYRGLCWYPEVSDMFAERLERSLELMRYY